MNEYQRAMELLELIGNGNLTEKNIGKYTYNHLGIILSASVGAQNGSAFYRRIKETIEAININELRKKDKINVFFMVDLPATWIGDKLFELFNMDNKFSPYVLLLSCYTGQSDELRLKDYNEGISFFSKFNDRFLSSINPETGEQYTFNDLGIRPDFCIWLNPWPKYRGDFDMMTMPLSTVNVYIPYGYIIGDTKQHDYYKHHFNQISQLMMWKTFYASSIMVDMARNRCFIGDSAAIYTGYPKMDNFYKKVELNNSVWNKVIEKSGNRIAKRIIYSPHHTIEEWEPIHFSTFKYNYKFILELARKYSDNTVWIFRPHPMLKEKAIRAGIFKNEAEWDDYVKEWDSLKNGMTYFDGDYADMMINSDAMIMDCVSFVAEYVFALKPLLFLESGNSTFDEYGEMIMSVHYRESGKAFDKIETFLKDVVLDGNDSKAEYRKHFFEEHMDYKKDFGGRSASENIFYFIKNKLKLQES